MKKIILTKEQNKLFNELKKLSKRANQRILTLERTYGKNVLAIRKLREKLDIELLDAWTKTGRIRISKRMTPEQMIGVLKATEDFIKNPLSTKRGVKRAKAKAIETIKFRFRN